MHSEMTTKRRRTMLVDQAHRAAFRKPTPAPCIRRRILHELITGVPHIGVNQSAASNGRKPDSRSSWCFRSAASSSLSTCAARVESELPLAPRRAAGFGRAAASLGLTAGAARWQRCPASVPRPHRAGAERHLVGGRPLPSVPGWNGGAVRCDYPLPNGVSDGLKHRADSFAFGSRGLEILHNASHSPGRASRFARSR